MSVFNELILTKVIERAESAHKNLNDAIEEAVESLRKFESEFQNSRASLRDKTQKEKLLTTTLQSIHEDEDEPKKDKVPNGDDTSESKEPKRNSKKRSKSEVEGILSPELDKRQKRGASVRAQTIITKQVNVNLTQKLRREDNTEKTARSRRNKESDKENELPVQIKQEKISLPSEPMDMESLPLSVVKQEPTKDDFAMPPPVAPVPKSRKAVQKEKSEETSEDEGGRRRTTRTRKQTDTEFVPPPASSRSTRSSRASSRAKPDDPPPADARPKRTRTKKKVSESMSTESIDTTTSQQSVAESPAEKPRPKRTRRGQKAEPEKPITPPEPEMPTETHKPETETKKPESKTKKPEAKKPETQKPETETISDVELISPKEERISVSTDSPLLQKPKKKVKEVKPKGKKKNVKEAQSSEEVAEVDGDTNIMLEETRVIEKNTTVTISTDMDRTMVLHNGVYNHAPHTPKTVTCTVNETVVIEKATRETFNIEKPTHAIMDATVVIEKDKTPNLTDDNSLLTNDSDDFQTPPKEIQPKQPTSAVKEKVQQFEELAQRTTRTKTRAMAKKDDPDTQTPPDKVSKPVLSTETLAKMNNMIFNGKANQISSSACKPRAPPACVGKVASSASKLTSLARQRDAADEARRKKEALLEAKRELHKKKREEKMAAAAAARAATEKERTEALRAAEKERNERYANHTQGQMERRREQERKKQELARKVAETEERRKAEEQARLQRLEEEQRRAEQARKKQLEEAAAAKKEEARMAREIEKRQKEYLDKQKMKRSEDSKSYTPLKGIGQHAIEPVYMQDGFQYLNSDEEDESPNLPIPDWSTSQARWLQLSIQSDVDPALEARLFSVRAHTPDLRAIFPSIDRSRLKRTSSAVWRTPPRPLPVLPE